MKLAYIYAFSAIIICTLCTAELAVAGEAGKTVGLSGEYALQVNAADFQRIRLLHSDGGDQNALSGVRSPEIVADAAAPDRAIGPEMLKVLSVIGSRTGDMKLLKKVKYKLTTMNDTKLHLAVSLSERAADGSGVRTDIAFFLLTTLIVFS